MLERVGSVFDSTKKKRGEAPAESDCGQKNDRANQTSEGSLKFNVFRMHSKGNQ